MSGSLLLDLSLRRPGMAVILPDSRLSAEAFRLYRSAAGAAGAAFHKSLGATACPLGALAGVERSLRDSGFMLRRSSELVAAVARRGEAVERRVETVEARIERTQERLARRGKALRDYQLAGIRWLAPRDYAMLCDDMGCGKTVQAIVALDPSRPCVVSCPAVAKSVWVDEAATWAPELRVSVLSGLRSWRWPEPGELVVTNFDILPDVKGAGKRVKKGDDGWRLTAPRGWGAEPPFTDRFASKAKAVAAYQAWRLDTIGTPPERLTIISDEAHELRNGKTLKASRFRVLRGLAEKRGGAQVWFLTATPLLNRPPELSGMLHSLGSSMFEVVFPGGWHELQRLFRATEGRYRGIKWGRASPEVAQRLSRVMLRRRFADIAPEVPRAQRRTVRVELTDPRAAQLADDALKALEESGLTLEYLAAKYADMEKATKEDGETLVFQAVSKAYAALSVARIPDLVQLVREYEQQDTPVLVFSAHREPVELLRERKGWGAILGGVSPRARKAVQDDFNAGSLRGVGLTIQAGGVAISLHKGGCHHAIFTDRLWVERLNAQAEARLIRLGQKSQVLITDLISDHPLEQRVLEVCAGKGEMFTDVIDAVADLSGRSEDGVCPECGFAQARGACVFGCGA